MDALQFDLSKKTLELSYLDIPKISDEFDVLIKVAYAGICGTDLHIIEGEFTCKTDGPFTLGHEVSGTVVEIGKGVKTVQVGDKVSIDPNNGCHRCESCKKGNPHFCAIGGLSNTIGIYRNGGWATFLLAPEEQVVKLPQRVTLEQGVLCEPVSCLAHGFDLIQPIYVGQKILITGAGIIGNLWAAVLHVQGHKNVTVSEPNQTRLELLRKLKTGFDCITPDELKKRQQNDENYLFDIVIDCSGYAPAIEQGFSLLSKGGKLCQFGVAPPSARISISPFEIFKKELSIIGVNINPHTFMKSVALMESMGDRYINYEALGIKTYSLKEYKAAIAELHKGTIAKAVFKM